MRRARRDQVQQEEADVEDGLGQLNHQSFEPGGLGDLDEGHQVHPLVLRLLHQGADPALVILHFPQATQVPDHAGHGRDRLQHDGAVAVAFGEEGVGAEPQQSGEAEREPVRKPFRRVVDDGLGVLLLIEGAVVGGENLVDHGGRLSSALAAMGRCSNSLTRERPRRAQTQCRKGRTD